MMAATLAVVSVNVFTRLAPNNQPSIGYATFSDGKTYDFFRETVRDDAAEKYVWSGGYKFEFSRTRDAIRERVQFAAPKRSAALIQFFNGSAA